MTNNSSLPGVRTAEVTPTAAGRVRAAAERVIRRVATVTGSWASRVPTAAVDLAPAVIMLAAMVAVWIDAAASLGGRFPWAVALSVVLASSLAARRRVPLTAYLVGTAAMMVESLWIDPGALTPFVNLIGLYSVGLYASPGRSRVGVLLVLPGILAYFAAVEGESPTAPVGVLFVWLLVWSAGYSAARRRERMEAYRQLMRREAIINERVRIARELHDLIGHTVNAMLVQAGAGRMVLDTDPDRARELMASVERTGRNALEELDRVLGVLRADDETQPGLGDLDQIVRPMTDAGMAVRVTIETTAHDLPRSVELSAYRIIQEALTNALRHGRARCADVVVRVMDGVLLIEVSDDGRGPASGYRPGRGLSGIAERVAVFGGAVEHGRAGHDPAGFVLRAKLPLPS